MSETIDELTMTYEEDGEVLVEELGKVVLSKGAWTTILFKYRDRRPGAEFSAPKFSIRRFQKVEGTYRYKSKFNISSEKQAKMIVDALNDWLAEA